MIQAWNRFGERAKGIEPHRILKLLPLELENEDEVLEKARDCNPGAFRDVLRELGGELASDACLHDETGTYCKKCHKHL